MKLTWRNSIIFFLFFAALEVVVKSSHFSPISGLEPLMILTLTLSAFSTNWSIVFYYLIFSFFTDLINLQTVGLVALCFFLTSLLVAMLNRVVNLFNEHKFIYSLLVFSGTLGLLVLFKNLFFGGTGDFGFAGIAVNYCIFFLVFLLFNSLVKVSVFKK